MSICNQAEKGWRKNHIAQTQFDFANVVCYSMSKFMDEVDSIPEKYAQLVVTKHLIKKLIRTFMDNGKSRAREKRKGR